MEMGSSIVKEKIIRKGAEANLYYGNWFGNEAIFKHRVPKKYRQEELDKRIRTRRTLNEARALIKVKTYGLNCPQVYEIDVDSSTIVMKYIKGEKLKDILEQMDDEKKVKLFKEIGSFIARLHQNGHVHGDITTSNMIITDKDDLFLIDFGLHEYSDSIEDKSVDLHLFKRVLISSHGKDYETCYGAFLEGYKEEYCNAKLDESGPIIKNIAVIETRGRYVKKEDRL